MEHEIKIIIAKLQDLADGFWGQNGMVEINQYNPAKIKSIDFSQLKYHKVIIKDLDNIHDIQIIIERPNGEYNSH